MSGSSAARAGGDGKRSQTRPNPPPGGPKRHLMGRIDDSWVSHGKAELWACPRRGFAANCKRRVARVVPARVRHTTAYSSRRPDEHHAWPKFGRAELQLAQMFGGRFRSANPRVSIRTGAMRGTTDLRPALRLVEPAVGEPVEFTWFCGHCAAPSREAQPPAPMARVCRSCGLGVMLETRADIVPSHRDAFLVIDSSLLVQAMSWRAETLLGVTEDSAVNRPVVQLLVPADAEAGRPARFAGRPGRGRRRRRRAGQRVRPALEHLRRAAPGASGVLRAPARGARGPRGPAGAPAPRRQLARPRSAV